MPRRTSTVRIRVTPAEHAAITAAAEGQGLGICSFSRMATLKAVRIKPAPPPRRKPDAHARAIAQWLGELGRIGSNLNQCARHANAGGALELAALLDIKSELQQLRELVLAFDAEAPP